MSFSEVVPFNPFNLSLISASQHPRESDIMDLHVGEWDGTSAMTRDRPDPPIPRGH